MARKRTTGAAVPDASESTTPASSELTPGVFVQRWRGRELSERASAQPHFTDLCRMLGVPAPTDDRSRDAEYGFEARTDISASGVYATRNEQGQLYRVETGTGGRSGGFADVWKRNHFAWEYKRAGKHRNLASALSQLRIYAPSLGNPPLLVVCDIDRFEIHTNFTGYPSTSFAFHISELITPSEDWKAARAEDGRNISPIEVLRKVFDDPHWFKPPKTREAVTAEYAKDIGELAKALRAAGNDPHDVAHFLMQIVFCFFAEDIDLLPSKVFTNLIEKCLDRASTFAEKARALFKAMELGGHFGADTIRWFNGGLYHNVDADPIINIGPAWLAKLLTIAKKDWNAVDPTIFGTLFERSLDPDKRSQIGAHYTSREDILLIVEPVVMAPLRQRWLHIQKEVAELLELRREEGAKPNPSKQRIRNYSKKIETAITDFVDHLGGLTILDPACGSGNFLFVTIQQLLDLENEVRAFAARPEIAVNFTQRIRPTQLRGIEVNDYACELARVSIWIGYLQWLHANSTAGERKPILDALDTIEHRDAILAWEKNGHPLNVWEEGATCAGKAEWPEADFIIGNPPFLGFAKFREFGLPEEYIQAMNASFDLSGKSDLCCYWFDIARTLILRSKRGGFPRVGLLATQAIRGEFNRDVLRRIKGSCGIFMTWTNRPWVVEGASVRVSIVGFDDGTEVTRRLDGFVVPDINADLTTGQDLRQAQKLTENSGISFEGIQKGGPFDVTWDEALRLMRKPNPNRRSSYEVLKQRFNTNAITDRYDGELIVDFGGSMSERDASQFEAPFDYIAKHVKPKRQKNRQPSLCERWWIHKCPRPEMMEALSGLSRILVTTRVSKFRLFAWLGAHAHVDSRLFAFAFDTDYAFGVLHSAVHEVWAMRVGARHGDGGESGRPTYNNTTCFETFPLPWPPGSEPVNDPRYKAIAAAAKELNELRENWLNPPEWIKAIEQQVDINEDFSDVTDEKARELLYKSAVMAYAAKDKKLKARTLTNLYNERPSWLRLAHRRLDEAVIAAYAHIDPEGDWRFEWAKVYEPFGAGEITISKKGKSKDSEEVVAAKQAAIAQRKQTDERILANLLRLNQERANTAR